MRGDLRADLLRARAVRDDADSEGGRHGMRTYDVADVSAAAPRHMAIARSTARARARGTRVNRNRREYPGAGSGGSGVDRETLWNTAFAARRVGVG